MHFCCAGIGNGMVFLQSIVMANLYFKKYRGLASGLTLAGGGIGLLVIPLIERLLISHYTWQPSLYIVAGICLNTCVAGALMRPVKLPKADNTSANLDNILHVTPGKSLLLNKVFILFCLSSFIWGLAVTVPIILGADFYIEMGMNGFQVNILLSCFGVGNLVGRLIGGIICNMKRLDKLV
ncbi:monocarboxylate transporter 12-like, partial [Liolophura sinensis]|uniref:monocarboxylate transporter 12-like n=1 Tax=Liolophura sinensis TaxID=3198878 RepID=UPI00315819DA